MGPARKEAGYAMAALLVSLSVMAILLSAVMPVWKQMVQREKEAELIFRGQQYARAIELMQRKMPGALPPNIDVLVDQHFLRKKYKDPITGDDFDLLRPTQTALGAAQPSGAGGRGQAPGGRGQAPGPAVGSGRQGGPAGGGVQAGISGVASKSKEKSIRLYNGRGHYNEWQFIHVARAPAPGAGAAPGRGGPGRGQGPGPGSPGTGDGRGRGQQQPPDGGRGGRGAPPFGSGPGAPNQPFPPNRPPGR